MRKKFKITKVMEPVQHRSGKWSVACFTTRGICVAAWDFEVIETIKGAAVPFDLSCDCKVPPHGVQKQFGHHFWVNAYYKITISEIPTYLTTNGY